MHIRTLAALASLIPAVLVAQTFTQIAPLPTQSNLWSVNFPSATNGFIAGDGHTLFKTTNGGDTWTKIMLPGYEDGPFYNVTFATPTLGFVSGNSAVGSKDIFRTIDGGATWDQVQSFPLGGSWYHQDYIDALTGFMGANGALVRTQDGGETWLLRSGYPDCPVIFGMDFIDESTGLVGGLIAGSSYEGIFKTTNGGQTWRLKHTRVANDVVYLSNLIAVADSGVDVVRTHDGRRNLVPDGRIHRDRTRRHRGPRFQYIGGRIARRRHLAVKRRRLHLEPPMDWRGRPSGHVVGELPGQFERARRRAGRSDFSIVGRWNQLDARKSRHQPGLEWHGCLF
ncbi:MAG: WD40/YVTN/BNR-like repeat-containing protein [Fimbriimonadales bacterium]